GEGKVVCVTGGSGYIASWLFKFLLERGYTVKATVRDPRAQIFPNDNYKFVDARDVANAHIGAFELASASGRLCLVGRVVHYSEFLKIIHKHYPTLHIPEKCQDDKPFVPKYEVSKEKAKALGIDFIPLDVRVVDTIESLKEKGFLNV
ncbi:hypothetical protein P3X46_035310, partial [Hevea brasiliensis]